MKKYLTIIFIGVFISCKAQNNKSPIDFFTLIHDPNNIWTTNYNIDKDDKFTAIYYEIYMRDVHIGQACIYAIPKQFAIDWTNEAIEHPTGNCSAKKNYKPLFYINCAARQYFINEKQQLVKNFDVYTFFIDKNDLEGPYKETSELGNVEYFTEKPNSKIIIYKYIVDGWVEIDKQSLGSETARTFGSKYIEAISKNKN